MTTWKRWWRWAFGVSCIPALALAQTAPGERERPAEQEGAHMEAQAVVVDPVQFPTLRQNFRPSEKPPVPNERIPVRENFQPELNNSMLSLD